LANHGHGFGQIFFGIRPTPVLDQPETDNRLLFGGGWIEIIHGRCSSIDLF